MPGQKAYRNAIIHAHPLRYSRGWSFISFFIITLLQMDVFNIKTLLRRSRFSFCLASFLNLFLTIL